MTAVSAPVRPRRQSARPARYGVSSPQLAALLPRLAAFVALGAFCALHWAALIAPYATGRLLAAVAGAAIGGVVLAGASTLEGRQRTIVLGVTVTAMALFALALSGIPLKFIGWRHWDELGAGISDGISALPGTTVPYRAADPWPGIMIIAGGTLLVVIAAGLAFWPRRDGRLGHPWAALIVLADVYAVPVVERNLPNQHASGAAFAALVLCFIALERIRPDRAGPMVVAAAFAGLAGLALAPRLDGERSWLDYNAIAESLARSDTVVFDWNHTYGPLDWPREGTVMLRVKAERPAYWKAENLDQFDGRRWQADRTELRDSASAELPVQAGDRPDWTQTLKVSVRNLRTKLLIGAGTTLEINKLGRKEARLGSSPGTFEVGRSLGRGDSYEARVYTPRPSATELRSAGTDYPGFTDTYLRMLLPGAFGRALVTDVSFSPFASGENGAFLSEFASQGFETESLIGESQYAETWKVSRRLALAAETPYDFARSVQAYFQKGFTYTESPPPARVPLEAFLARDKAGYCQQFSGSMALILRMGGVPARVASGFTTGARDKGRGDYEVKDTDAHSWVEAYFPGIGWVPFDPTPAAAPARGGDGRTAGAPTLGPIPGGRAGLGEDAVIEDPGDLGLAEATDEATPWGRIAGAIVAIALLLGGGALLFARRRGRGAGAGDPWLAELERALRRTGRPLAPATTLAELEARLGAGARGYLAALRARRFQPGAAAPSPDERAELRRELSRGLGVAGRLRGLWALPPRRGA